MTDVSALKKVCRAAIGSLMGRSPSIIRVDRVEDGVAYTSYHRPSDNTLWKDACKLKGDRVMWAGVDAFGPGTGQGRWRNDPADEVVTYAIHGDKVSITTGYGDGSGSTETFTVR